MDRLWLIKDQKSRVKGPFTEKEISDGIKEGRFADSSLISDYPGGKWNPILSHPAFYKAFLKTLEDSSPAKPDLNDKAPPLDATVIIPHPGKKRKKFKIQFHRYKKSDEAVLEKSAVTYVDPEKIPLKKLPTKKILFVLIALCFAVVALLFLTKTEREPSNWRTARLLSPGKQKPLMKKSAVKEEFKQVVLQYKRDTVPSYLKSQKRLISILEKTRNYYEGYAQLCLIHLELWPYAYQDFKDRKALAEVRDRISRIDKGGVYSGLCSAVNAFIFKKYEKGLMIVESSLNALNQTPSEYSPVFFYYLKARFLSSMQRGREAVGYLQGIYGLLPNWIAPYMLEGRILRDRGDIPTALKRYQKVLSFFPQHTTAGLLTGIVEYSHFGKTNRSERRLKSILSNSSEPLDPRILAEAYTVLTHISLKQKDDASALQYAKKAHALDPSNVKIADIIFKISGTKELKSEKITARQLIYRGDLLMEKGDCAVAQEYYEKAYQADDKKNALAAKRMGECFWKQGMSGEAFQWLKRAVSADPQMISAHFLLADYYSRKYFFELAEEVLKAARRRKPDSYELFKGYALLAMRQNNPRLAINYGEKALSLYTSDVDVYVLLSKAYRAVGERSKAYDYAAKAVEEDVNSVSGQISYAIALGSAYGFSRGEEHFKTLIQTFPLVLEYQQALGEYYFEKDKLEEGEPIFIRIIEQNTNFKEAYIYLGRIYSLYAVRDEGGEVLDTAVTYFLKASLLDPADPEPLFYMGRLYLDTGKLSLAEDQFQKVMRLNEKFPLIHYYIGLTNFLQGGEDNLKRAVESARTEIQRNPNLASAYILLGDIYKKKGETAGEPQTKRGFFEMCAREYQQAVRLRPKSVDIYVNLVNCYVGSGETDAALQIVRQFIRGQGTSGYAELYRLEGRIYEMKGDYQNAGTAYERYFGLNPSATDRGQIESRLKPYYQFKSRQ